MRHISKEEYERNEKNEKEGVIHPCDHWDAKQCMCKGACSCHWREPAVTRYVRGEKITNLLEEIEDEIDEWHSGNTGRSLMEWIGMSDEEYDSFVTDPHAIFDLLLERR